ncbi:hypothetical protein E4T56_gene14969, partial [Termitomyces sp. T112]
RNARRSRRQQRGQGRIAAKAHHGAGRETVEQAQRHRPPVPDRAKALDPADRVPALQPARRQHMGGQVIGLAGDRRAALIRDQRDMMPARMQFGRQRKGRDQMAPGAACGQNAQDRRMALRGKGISPQIGIAPRNGPQEPDLQAQPQRGRYP